MFQKLIQSQTVEAIGDWLIGICAGSLFFMWACLAYGSSIIPSSYFVLVGLVGIAILGITWFGLRSFQRLRRLVSVIGGTLVVVSGIFTILDTLIMGWR